MADEGKSEDMPLRQAVRPLPIEDLHLPPDLQPDDAIKRAAVAFRRERRLITLIAALVAMVVLAGGVTVGVLAGRQSEIRRNGELTLCIAALESRLHLGEIAILQAPDVESRIEIIQALDLNELAFRLQRLDHYCN
jgi:hypothetical protein